MYHIIDDRSLMTGRLPEEALAFALATDGAAVAEIFIETHDTCPPHLLGSLPSTELVVTRLTYDAAVPDSEIIRMISHALRSAREPGAEYVRYRVNPEFTPEAGRRRRLAQSAGMELFSEKLGLELDLGDLPAQQESGELDFVSLDDLGDAAFVPILARIGMQTLDRNDRWFHERAGADNWARVFLTMCGVADRSSWLAGFDGDEPVGFIGVSEMQIDEPTPWDSTPCGTISMIGVVPEHRGRGHAGTLLRAGIAAARTRRFAAMLDSVDVLNTPMLNAMARCGYRDDTRPWHDWFFRAAVGG